MKSSPKRIFRPGHGKRQQKQKNNASAILYRVYIVDCSSAFNALICRWFMAYYTINHFVCVRVRECEYRRIPPK